MAFCESSSGVRRAASRATKSFIVASSSQASPTSLMDGPAHTAATEISGPLWRGTDISCAAPRLSATREKFSRGIVRKDRADHEQSRASADDRKRNPIDLAVKCKADDAHTAAANVDQTRRTSCDLICVRGATLQTFQQELAKPSWDAARECSTICVMDQCHAWARGGDSISATVPKKVHVRGAIASTSSPSSRSILAHRPGEVQRNGPPHYGAWGAMGELQMNSKLTKLAAAGVLSL